MLCIPRACRFLALKTSINKSVGGAVWRHDATATNPCLGVRKCGLASFVSRLRQCGRFRKAVDDSNTGAMHLDVVNLTNGRLPDREIARSGIWADSDN